MPRRAAKLVALALLRVLLPSVSAPGQSPEVAQRERGSIVGRIVDSHHQSIPAAEVFLFVGDSVVRYARSDSSGAFELTPIAVGTHAVVVRRLGFKERRVDVIVARLQPPTTVDVVLIAIPAELEQVRVEASIDESKGKLREFYEHRARAQFGYFFGPENLDRDKLRNTSDIMRRVPGAQLLPARFGHRVLFRGCRPLVWIDGQRAVGAELDEISNPQDIAAIEIYPSMAGLPPQYVGPDSRCGVIVVWTRVS
jgi:hypothetical protein